MTWDVNDVMHRKRARRIWGIWEKSVRLSELAEALEKSSGKDCAFLSLMSKNLLTKR